MFHLRTRMLLCAIMLMILYGCAEKHPLHPSYEELKQRGFYVYVLPERELDKYEWTQTISIWSWDRHCKGIEWTENFNPIRIEYVNTEKYLFIIIGPWNMYWDSSQKMLQMEIDTRWAKDRFATYYMLDDGIIHMRFEDSFGINVQIISNLPVDEIKSLVSQLEYIGPPPELVTNPWDFAKCQDNRYSR